MQRLAWFSPMPPERSGIAACSADLVTALTPGCAVDVYVDEAAWARAATAQGRVPQIPIRSAHEFVWRHGQQPYDMTVYQLGNSSHHEFIWPYVFRFPGLTVLHDAHLHHARAAALLRSRRASDYRAEFAAAEPDAPPDAAELAVAGFDSHLYYMWPMTRLVVAASRLVAVHTAGLAAQLRAVPGGTPVEAIHLGHGVPVSAVAAREARRRVRAPHGIAEDAILFGCFGGLTPDKRIPQVLDAFAALLPYVPEARLLLAGAPSAQYDVAAAVAARGLEPYAVLTGYLESDDELTEHIAACDVTLNLRWPTAREVSGPWLRCLAAGKPTVVIDLAHMDVPSLDPRTWTVNQAAGAPAAASAAPEGSAAQPRPPGSSETGRGPTHREEPRRGELVRSAGEPVTVAIDILDEDHSLRLAMRRLARDPELRTSLGRAAAAWWEQEHTPERMLEDYRRIIARAAATPAPRPALPPHLVNHGGGTLRTLLQPFGESVTARIPAL